MIVPLDITHPVFTMPTKQEFLQFVSKYGEKAFDDVMIARNKRIEAEKIDPYLHGVELPAWLLADWVLGRISWEDFCNSKNCPDKWKVPEEWKTDKLRESFEGEPATLLLILGGTGSTKTEYMLKRLVEDARNNPEHISWVFHESKELSVDTHHKAVYKYIPEEWKQAGKGTVGYVSYKTKTGFAEGNFIGNNGSNMRFRSYEQDIKTIESGKLGSPTGNRTIGFVGDELMPMRYFSTLRGRLASRNASGVVGFTPLQGYSDVVAWFRKDAKTMLSRLEVDITTPKNVPLVEMKIISQENERPMKIAVVYFHSIFSPYANYEGLKQLYGGDSDEVRLIRYDGYCQQERQNLFPRFKESVHLFKIEDLPEIKSVYHIVDPSGLTRNWVMLWVAVDIYGRLWVFREWPCRKIAVPNHGFPGPWAEEGQTSKHKYGGVPGMGSKSFGFSILDYKNEIARLEGWHDLNNNTLIEDCDELQGSDDNVVLRFMDSRFMNTGKASATGNTTLGDECEKVKLFFNPTSGAQIINGVKLINNLLAYKPDWSNPTDGPQLFICEDCQNILFAVKNYTAMGGQSEACKDFIDLLRYAVEANLEYIDSNLYYNSSRVGLNYNTSNNGTIDKNKYYYQSKGDSRL